MIQRYRINIDGLKIIGGFEDFIQKDNKGELVKWEDIELLMPIYDAMMKCIDETADEIIKGTSTMEPKGIMQALKDGEKAKRKLLDTGKELGIQIIDNDGQIII